MSAAQQAGPAGEDRREQPQNIAASITEISERATLLVREEIELAKAEVIEKGMRLARGAVVGIVAGVFFLTALFFALIGCALLLYFYLPVNDWAFFWGFFAMAVILVLLGVIAGLIAARFVKRGAPPTPSMAIDEARKIREAVNTQPVPRAPAPPPANVGAEPAAAPNPTAGGS
jgi:MFS family permease